MDKYNKKANLLNQLSQTCEKINNLTIEMQEGDDDLSYKNLSKLTKGVGFVKFFIDSERKCMKKIKIDQQKSSKK